MNLPIVGPVVTICTTGLTFNNSTFCPHGLCLLRGTDWMVFIYIYIYIYIYIKFIKFNLGL